MMKYLIKTGNAHIETNGNKTIIIQNQQHTFETISLNLFSFHL